MKHDGFENRQQYIFLSYSSEDKVVADAVCAGLESQGIRCWIAPRDVGPGQDWAATIVDAIEDCRVFVIILSAGSNKSSQVLREVERAVNAGKIVIPFRIEELVPSKSLGYFLSLSHWLDAMTEPLEQHIDELAENIRNLFADKKMDGKSSSYATPPPEARSGVDGPSLLSRSGERMQSVLHDNNKLHIVIAVLLTIVLLGLGWFFLYGRSPNLPVSQPGMMGSGMNQHMNKQDRNNWR